MAVGPVERVRGLVLISIHVALIIAGAYLILPLPGSPVPIVLQNFFVIVGSMILGPIRGGVAVVLYLLMGAVGLPVFAGGSAGLGHFLGPTGGYLVGFVPGAIVSGGLSSRRPGVVRDGGAAVAGMVAIYVVGLPWLKYVLEVSWPVAVGVGALPFLIGDGVKAVAAVGAARVGRRAMSHGGTP